MSSEMQALADELQQDDNIDSEVVDSLDAACESIAQASEALATVRETRHQLRGGRGRSPVRSRGGRGRKGGSKGRGGSSGSASSFGGRGSESLRNRKANSRCVICKEKGHWKGDPECKGAPDASSSMSSRPGSGGRGRDRDRPFRETNVVETERLAYIDEDEDEPYEREVLACSRDSETLAVQPNTTAQTLSLPDAGQARDPGCAVLDTACRFSVAGSLWWSDYEEKLKSAGIGDKVSQVAESHVYRFGDGGTLSSTNRVTAPAILGGRATFVTFSVVPSTTLGLLLGRDQLELHRIDVECSSKCYRCNGVSTPLKLSFAGHYSTSLKPE